MNASQLTDQELITSIQSVGPQPMDSYEESSKYLFYNFSIGKTFYISIHAGFALSVPEDILENLADYEKVSIRLYHYKEPPPIEDTHMDPMEFSFQNPDGTTQLYKFSFNVRVFPHIKIDPSREEPFKHQPWAESFSRSLTRNLNFADDATILPWRDVCDVIRYCDKISRLKMFW
jgi:hypothetical protein